MNDLETRLRDLLAEDARHAPDAPEAVGPVRRARRHQALTVSAAITTVVALAGAGFLVLRSLEQDTVPTSTVERAVNGITMSIPPEWYLVDPVDIGSEPSGELPRLIALLSDVPPDRVVRCPAEMPSSVLLTIQQHPLALDGPTATPWPVELEARPLDPETPIAETGCYAGWTFMRAEWTAAGRTFEAVAGFGGETPAAAREALITAFESMTFAEARGTLESVVLATGPAGGQEWQLIASRTDGGLDISLQSDTSGSGVGDFGHDEDLFYASSTAFGSGDERQTIVVFGAAGTDIVRVEAFPPGGGRGLVTDVIDVPDELAANANAFVLLIPSRPSQPIELNAYDADGRTVAHTTVGPQSGPGEPVETPLDPAGEPGGDVLFRGRTNECLWQIRAEPSASDPDSFVLWPLDNSPPTFLTFSRGAARDPMQLAWFTCPSGGTVVFGTITEEVAEIQWVSPAGPGVREGTGCTREDLLPDDVCFFLSDHGDLDEGGTAIGYDAQGREVDRIEFG